MSEKVKPGYKQTEVGVIPEEWEVTRIESIATVEGGYAFSSKKFLPRGKYQIVKMSNLYGGSLNLDRSASYLNELDEQEKHYLLHRDEILITLTGTTGKRDYGYLYKINNEQNLLLNQRVGRLIVGETASPSYVAFQIKTPCFLDQFFDLSKGGTGNQTNVGTQDVAAIHIPLPPLPEQRAIAGALSDVDALLGALDQLIAKKRDLKQAAMQQLLTGQNRLPGFHGEWETKKIGELLRYERPDKYLVKCADYHDNAKTPVLTANKSFVLGYTNEDFGIYGDLPTIIFDDFTTDSKYVDFPFKVKSSAIKILKTRSSDTNLKFVYERIRLVNYPLGEHKRYYISEFQHEEILTPKPDEQTAIAEVLSDTDAELAALTQRRDKTRALKQGMMQELLTGRVRLTKLKIENG